MQNAIDQRLTKCRRQIFIGLAPAQRGGQSEVPSHSFRRGDKHPASGHTKYPKKSYANAYSPAHSRGRPRVSPLSVVGSVRKEFGDPLSPGHEEEVKNGDEIYHISSHVLFIMF